MPIPVLAVQIVSLTGSAASIASGVYNFLTDHSDLAGQLDEVMSRLGELSGQIATATSDILEAIDGIRRQIDEDVANDNIALANRALYSDLFTFDNFEQAMGNSLQAAERLNAETGVSFAASFMYVVNIRLIVIRAFDPNCYLANRQFIDQFRSYTNRLDGWIREIIDSINAAHTVTVVTQSRGSAPPGSEPDGGPQFRVVARHLRQGVIVAEFASMWIDIAPPSEAPYRAAANRSRDRGIAEDRQQSAVPDMEVVAAAWRQAFMGNLRLALISQVLNRPRMAIDSNPNGVMVDGRILPISSDNLDLRTTLMELLCSRQFRNRIQMGWDAFVNHSDDRLAQFAYRRLFEHDATPEEITLLRGMASNYGYTAFIAALLHCNEYEERYGRGLPGVGQPIIDALQSTQ